MIIDFLRSLQCVLQEEESDYRCIIDSWSKKDNNVALMPAVSWYNGTCNLFEEKAGAEGQNMIWLIPAGQRHFCWLPTLKKTIEAFYENDELELSHYKYFPGIETEEFEECILLHSEELQDNPEHTILGANIILVRLTLSSGRDTILFILLDHQDNCWKNIIEGYRIQLTWLVDSGRGTGDYYARINLYQLMKNTPYPETLPAFYFKGLYNKGELPEGFRFLYAMLSHPDADGYDIWEYFSAVYDTGWREKSPTEN